MCSATCLGSCWAASQVPQRTHSANPSTKHPQIVSASLSGRLLAHDLRSLRSPLADVAAHSSAITATALQPRPAATAAKTSKSTSSRWVQS